MWLQLLRKQANTGTSTPINAHTISRALPSYDVSLGLLTYPTPEVGDFVELRLLYKTVQIVTGDGVIFHFPSFLYSSDWPDSFQWPFLPPNKFSDYLKIKKVKLKWSRYRPGVAQRVGRGIALLFHDRGTRRGWVVSSTARPHFTPGKDRLPILQEAWWAPVPVWTSGKSRPHRESIPDSRAHSQSLYHLS